MQKYTRLAKRSSRKNGVEWKAAADIEKRVKKLANELEIDWVNLEDIYCFRSENSKSRAYARIWGLSKIWQKALKQKPAYVIEVLTEKFYKLPQIEQDKVLLHELTHIPKNFSGSLLPHIRKRGMRNFEDRVRLLVRKYNLNKRFKL